MDIRKNVTVGILYNNIFISIQILFRKKGGASGAFRRTVYNDALALFAVLLLQFFYGPDLLVMVLSHKKYNFTDFCEVETFKRPFDHPLPRNIDKGLEGCEPHVFEALAAPRHGNHKKHRCYFSDMCQKSNRKCR